MKPNTDIVNLRIQHQLLAGSDQSYNFNDAEDADDDTKDGGWNARQQSWGGAWDDEEE